ncbi:MAG: peptide chain release factor N(5)-glutamine methyltransferase [Burkholderiales bacterium]
MASLATLLKTSGLPLLEARVLAAHALQVDRVWISAHEKDDLSEASVATIENLYRRRRAGEPVAYLTGEREFYGLSLAVTPAVLIPRPETELLVDCTLPLLRDGCRVLDLGTGSGAIAIALALHSPVAQVFACDASSDALDLARGNAQRLGARVNFIKSDWFAAMQGQRFDVVVSNPPYIAIADPHLEEGDLRFEPREALVAGVEGIECIEAIAAAAREHLLPGGSILMEHGYDQGPACVGLLQRLAYIEVIDHVDLSNLPRVVQARFDP